MNPNPSYPVWLSAFMLIGPFFMVGAAWFANQRLVWVFQIAGAGMVMIALFCLSKRLHEQKEEVGHLRLLNSRDDDRQASSK